MCTPLVAIILAGGRSSRMGQDKANLRFNEQSFLEIAYATCRQLGADEIMVSGNYPEYGAVVDKISNQGPLMGIYSCLRVLIRKYENARLLIIPVDMPTLSIEQLKPLIMALQTSEAAVYQDHPLPLALQLNQKLREWVQSRAYLFQGAIHRFIKHLGSIELDGESAILRNMNTPEDLQQLKMV